MLLRSHPDTAENGRAGERRMYSHVVEAFENLRREFTRWRDDQRARRSTRLREQLMHDRQQKRIGLAAARHGACEHVTTLECWRNRLALNGGRAGEAEVFEALVQTRMQLQRSERRCGSQNLVRRKGGWCTGPGTYNERPVRADALIASARTSTGVAEKSSPGLMNRLRSMLCCRS